MSLQPVRVGLASVALLALASLVVGEKPKKAADGDDKQVVTSKGTKRASAASVNFRKELNLPFPTLGTLGPRVAAARRSADPVALAQAASELSVAEKVSGKKASLTSSALMQEAAELAKLKQQKAQVQALLHVTDQVATTEDSIAGLRKVLADAEARFKAEQEAYRQNQEPTWKPRQLIVNNYTNQYLDIFVNGDLKTQVEPGQRQVYVIEHRWNPTVLTAYGNDDTITWGPRYVWGQFDKYTWNIE
jgi:hypothetical protein